MTLQEILAAVGGLETEIAVLPPGDAELAAVLARIAELEEELDRVRASQGSLLPDDERDSGADQAGAQGLEQALHSLKAAVNSKREAVPPP